MHKILPGIYYRCDPCYCFDDDAWDRLLSFNQHFDISFVMFDGYPVYGFSTMYGDGSYYGSDGHYYDVDSGSLSLVHEELFKKYGDGEVPHSSTKVVVTENDILYATSAEGTITLAGVWIDTGNNCDDIWDDDPGFDQDDWDHEQLYGAERYE